ncbi:aminomethyl transferase family protein [Chelativorans intermedius]|uniref:Aminomethyl transferase family protein n=1 Tax=Chelativorans intermedius TaxID=515947 RepID=A0ABV6D5L9_9HYPH|nr:aminomethyl transferase family protein [Chelativorans intermedius]MCT8998850.1 aminomethyl transferase family protein [Chelativorans intermedius]
MSYSSLEEKLQALGNPALMLQNAPAGRYVYPIAPEFTNWIEEQRAWRETAVLFDQSFHMTDLYVKGPDVVRLLSHLGINSFQNFGRNKAKQFVCCNHDGYVIGDVILFGLEDDLVSLVGRPPVPNWVQFHAETGGYDVTVERDERTADEPGKPRKTYRYEVQGPNAMKILEAVNEGGPLTTRFFHMGEITIAGCRARTLAHGMGGAPGLELWGPAEEGPKVKAALIEAGQEHGLRQAGARAYSTVAMESGWIPSPLPAIYTGEKMRPYREWLPATSFEAVCSIGGSFQSENVEDYYLTPWDLDYGRMIRFDHDFIGREALERMAGGPHRRKVTLVWDKQDVLKVYAGLMEEGEMMPKLMEMPAAHYAAHPYDRVVRDGRTVGISTYPVYTANERAWISLATVEEKLSQPGTHLTVIWGEAEGGTRKPAVERHRQTEIGATVHPWPIHEASRRTYRARK